MLALVRKPPCKLNNFCVLITTESRAKIWPLEPPMALAAAQFTMVVLLLLFHCMVCLGSVFGPGFGMHYFVTS